MYRDGSLVEIRIWQVRRSSKFPNGMKYALYLIGPPPERRAIIGYDNHHGKGDHRHAEGLETPIDVVSVSALLRQFRREVAEYLGEKGIVLKGAS